MFAPDDTTGGNGMDQYVRLPAKDLPGIVGFILMTVVAIAVAKRLPVIKQFV